MVSLKVNIAGLELKNPIITASGTFGYGKEFEDFIDLSQLGAIIVKSISLKPRQGNKPPRTVETPSGMLNAIGLQNEGVEKFLSEKLPYLERINTVIIANIVGESTDEFKELAKILNVQNRIDAFEINISCPNVKKGGITFSTSPDLAFEVISAIRNITEKPIIAKLSPNVTDITVIAKSAEDAGADALSLINTIVGMAVDIETRKPILGNITGGLSGPAIKPIGLRMVYQVINKVKIPVIGIGGIMNYKDALEYLLIGAKAVQIGTANFINPKATIEIIDGIRKFLEEKNISDINGFIGTLIV